MYLLGVVLSALCFCCTVWIIGGDPNNFVDLALIFSALVPIAAVLAATKSFKVFYAGMRALILPKEEITEEMRGRAASLFRFLSKTTGFVAVIITLICLMIMLMALDFSDPLAINRIGGYAAASMLAIIYGLLLIAFVFEPAVFILKRRGVGRR